MYSPEMMMAQSAAFYENWLTPNAAAALRSPYDMASLLNPPPYRNPPAYHPPMDWNDFLLSSPGGQFFQHQNSGIDF